TETVARQRFVECQALLCGTRTAAQHAENRQLHSKPIRGTQTCLALTNVVPQSLPRPLHRTLVAPTRTLYSTRNVAFEVSSAGIGRGGGGGGNAENELASS